jgi:hypothetical protein
MESTISPRSTNNMARLRKAITARARRAEPEPPAPGPCCGAGGPAVADLRGSLIDPQTYMKVVAHQLRRKLLSQLARDSASGPVTKKQMAEAVGVDYETVNYQLNRHLSEFWTVKERRKVRGAYQEYIMPEPPNAIYVNLGSQGAVYIIDPLAGIFGKLGDVGTRCDRCSRSVPERKRCLDGAMAQDCFAIGDDERSRLEAFLERNGRRRPFTPVDHMLFCAVVKGMERSQCVLVMGECGCAAGLTRAAARSTGRS